MKRRIMAACAFGATVALLPAPGGDLAARFRTPPPDARPHTWWHWMNGNVTKEGIKYFSGTAAYSKKVAFDGLKPGERLVLDLGDDRLCAEDCAWRKADYREAIVALPQWVKDGKPSPTGRRTFTTWKLWNKDDALLPSGLLGPVILRTEAAPFPPTNSKTEKES